MQIVFHLGAHCTEQERLFKCLLSNQAVLEEQGILVPDPEDYRNTLRDMATHLRGKTASTEQQNSVLEHIIGTHKTPQRLVLGWENFLSFPRWAFRKRLYPTAAERVRAFTHIFPDHKSVFYLALRNLASLLPALHTKLSNKTSWEEFTKGADLLSFRWEETVSDIALQNPGVPLHVWCDEDSPLIWYDLLMSISGCEPSTQLKNADSFPLSLMREDGVQALASYVQSRAIASPEAQRALIPHFLERYGRPERLEQDIDVPDWTQDTLTTFDEIYADDVAAIKEMSGVDFIAPP